MKKRRLSPILLVALLAASGMVSAQQVRYYDKGRNNASRGDVSVSYGGTTRYPRNYEYYYSQSRYQPVAQVRVQAVQTPIPAPRILGPVKRYSDLEYSNLVLGVLNNDKEESAEATSPTEKVKSSPTSAPTPEPTPAMTVALAQPAAAKPETPSGPVLQSATVVRVEDRGVLVTADGRRIRMRGLAFPSVKSNHEIRRNFATQATAMLENLVKDQTVYFVVEEPEKGLDGSVLAIVHLRDGTEINRLALESGMAIISPSEFASEDQADRLISAELEARKQKHGIWKVW